MKKYKLYLFLTLTAFSFTRCEENQRSMTMNFNNYDMDIYIHFINVKGENILDKNPSIEIFYDNNGAMYKVDRPHLDAPNGYTIEYKKQSSILKLYTSDFFLIKGQRIYSKTYVKLNGYLIDTFTCELYADGSTLTIIKVWHNDNLVWEVGEVLYNSSRSIEIVK